MKKTVFPFQQVFFSIPSILVILFAVVLLQIPLFHTLGYEFSFALNLVSAPLSGFFIISLQKKNISLVTALAGWFYVLCIPLTLSLLMGFFVKNCDIKEGILFFTHNVIIGNVLAGCIATHFKKRLKYPYIAWIIFILLSISYRLYQLYIGPSISFYDHLWGFYSGAIYDENVGIDQKIQIFRITTMVIVSLLFITVHSEISSKKYIIIICLIITFIVLLKKGYDYPLYHTYNKISQELTLSAKNKQYQIVYSVSDQEEILLFAKDHAFRLYQLQKWFDDKDFKPFTTYLYDSSDQKAKLMGARATQITFPWRNEVHVQKSGFPHPVLKHEIAHILAGKYAQTSLLHVPEKHFFPQMSIIEGLATAATWSANDYDPHAWSKALLDLTLLPKIEDIITSDGFLYSNADLAYTVMGSFIRYLKDSYGIQAITKLYQTADFKKAFQKPIFELESDWIKMLNSLPSNSNLAELAKEYFSEKSIFEKVCPHQIAKHTDLGWTAFEQSRFQKAYYHFKQCASYDQGNTDHLLNLLYTVSMAGDWDKSLSLAYNILSHPNKTTMDLFRTYMVLGDMYFFINNFQTAKKYYHLAEALPNYPANQAIAMMKHDIMNESVSSIMIVKDLLTPKFSFTSTITNISALSSETGFENTNTSSLALSVKALENEFSPIINAAIGYHLFVKPNHISSITYLENALQNKNNFRNITMYHYFTKLLIQAYYHTHKTRLAQNCISKLIQSTDIDILTLSWAKDWNERLEFERKEGLILESE